MGLVRCLRSVGYLADFCYFIKTLLTISKGLTSAGRVSPFYFGVFNCNGATKWDYLQQH
jgi:hypothetical protein